MQVEGRMNEIFCYLTPLGYKSPSIGKKYSLCEKLEKCALALDVYIFPIDFFITSLTVFKD